MPNRLADASSPYLLQHRDNPVHWQPWDAEALARAKAEDKPILLSVGYAACHWCHVMAHESFENAEIGALMNERFVNIKVDREERPDLDQIYQHALALLGQHGGWPLTMFLTPDLEPFWGGTYFPPDARYGRPGFPQVLETVSRIWHEERDKVTGNTVALKTALARLASPEVGPALTPAFGAEFARRLVQAFDTINGGLAGAPKFPQAPLMHFLWREALLRGDATIRHALLHSIARICQGGIYDHLGGGFARYSVDAMWLVPHFEKMLYDNAQLLGLLADVYAEAPDPLFAARARETVGWLEREMLVEDAFASSLDADSEGEEGRFYVWEADEIDRLLGPAAGSFRLAYGVTDQGNWEGRTVLNRLHHPGLLDAGQEAELRRSADILLEARERRVRPGLDDKVLADWNGLMIQALVRAAAVFGQPAWLERAERSFQSVCRNLGVSDDRLVHSWRAGRRLELAFLDDYGQMAAAALALYEHTSRRDYLEQAERWVATLERDYLDPERGGYFLTPAGEGDVLVRAKNAQDGPMPSGNGAMVSILARLFYLTGRPEYRQRAEQQLSVFSGETQRNPLVHAALLSGALLLEHPVQVVVVGKPSDPAFEALKAAALAAPVPDRIVLALADGDALPQDHPAAGKGPLNGRASAYVCIGQTCRLPITAPDELTAALRPDSLRSSSV